MADDSSPTAVTQGLVWELLRGESESLLRSFNDASALGRGTPQEVSDRRESAFRDVIKRFFPAPHFVTKGQVLGVDGSKSASIDCVVLNPVHPHTVDSEGKFKLLFADGVDFVVEVKGRLNGKELDRLLKQCQSVKQVQRSKTPLILEQDEARKRASMRIPFFAYCHESALSPTTIAKAIRDWVAENEVPPEERPEVIAVHGSGIYFDLSVPWGVGQTMWAHGPTPEEQEKGRRTQIWHESGEMTLGVLIALLSHGVPAVMPLVAPILTRYTGSFLSRDSLSVLGRYPAGNPDGGF